MAITYSLPFFLYLGGTAFVSQWPEFYAFGYTAVVILVGMATAWLWRGQPIPTPHPYVLSGCVVGIVGIAAWIGVFELGWDEQLQLLLSEWLRPETRLGYNPFESISNSWAAGAFVAVRITGLVLLVPLIEELFWRGFLARWLRDPDWEKVPLGDFTLVSFLGVTLLFMLAHPEWLAAAIYCALLNLLLIWKRDLWNCIVAHAVSNAILAGYVLATNSWSLW